MDESDSDTGINDFLVKKESYEMEKTLLLQKDEIKRLKDELRLLNTHINSTNEHFSQTKKIYRHKIKEIVKEIEAIPTSLSLLKSELISTHTKNINSLKREHHKELKSLKIHYREEMMKINENVNNLENENELYVSPIELDAEFLIRQKAEEQEAELQQRISDLKSVIKQDRIKAKKLQKEIDKLKEVMDLERQEAEAYHEKVMADNMNIINAKLTEEVRPDDIQFIEKEAKAEENRLKKENNAILEELRNKLVQVQFKNQQIKIYIDSNRTISSPELDQAVIELSKLEKAYKFALIQQSDVEKIKLETLKQKQALRKTMKSIKALVSDLDDARAENALLYDEIQRLDFMIYGRCGQFQKMTKPRPKITHWVC
ncbi:hypothetical protein TRFO_00934 [Tritrichomonas foetus]|uniref:Uncharacterized protein n=1 Tax=Tritrichomonas foetus TaxID=1144522 RepID=A0A1J4L6L9_9EUKA|nr:hypothetical protein TRFO_00934 [Tritrichomonas foetus]|eukprot:OHT17652.1 hypothetical protein TRFO_00934 [Tritrichomonas foetus]